MTSAEKNTKVKIKYGELQGTIENLLSGNTYVSFKGIPYAKPPIGNLRFKAPQPPDSWSGIRDASKHGPVCPQVYPFVVPEEDNASEDCLYLNVYTPSTKGPKTSVMVWFHGGGFVFGSGNSDFYGPAHLLEENIVLVTANYRLEVFGFLNLDTPEIAGNAGMKDQVAVLRWVKENIASFGGDPNNVTIFGESAGAASVTYHMFSPMSEGLFHRIIAQSGCCLNEWAFGDRSGRKTGIELAKVLGKDTQDIKELINFFKNLEAVTMVGVTELMMNSEEKFRGLKIFFNPTVEKSFPGEEAFLLKPPLELLAEGKFHKVPIMMGYCDKEGLMLTKNAGDTTEKILEFIRQRMPFFIRESFEEKVIKQAEEKIKRFYFNNKTDYEDVLSSVEDLESDVSFTYHIMHFARVLSKLDKNPVYMYRYCVDGDLNIPKMMLSSPGRKGACHSDDLCCLFHMGLEIKEGSMEWKTIRRLCKMWTNFARFSDPTPSTDNLLQIKWNPITPSKINFLNIDEKLVNVINPDHKRFEFWDQLYNDLSKSKKIKSNL